MSKLKIVFGYIAWSAHAASWHESAIRRAQLLGFDVEAFCLTPGAPAPRLHWRELDRLWSCKDPGLVSVYERLVAACETADVFWCFNGANVHPAWLEDLPTLNVYGCFDDPESTSFLSEPVAKYFDAALVGNLSCIPLYQSWGLRQTAWCPLGFIGDDFSPEVTPEAVLNDSRSIDCAFVGERESPWRKERFDRLHSAFPKARFHGNGWPDGRNTDDERKVLYRDLRVGWNLHNSIGPINLRLLALLANGVLQICDNRCRLGQVLQLEREVIGFDEIDDCIDRTNYFLEHESERREIAANGLRRYLADYSEPRLWEYYTQTFESWMGGNRSPETAIDRLSWIDSAQNATSVVSRKQPFVKRLGSLVNHSLARAGLRVIRVPQIEQPESVPKPTTNAAEGGSRSITSVAYAENVEVGAKNLSEKLTRVQNGGLFEWPNIVALNWAVARMVGDARKIVEIGCGTGAFAYEAAADPRRQILAADGDGEAIAWARENRSRPNIMYTDQWIVADDGPFDLAASMEVVEHLDDYHGMLKLMCALAPKSIVTTPNRSRAAETRHAGPPTYHQHVREWTAGEFYWVLKSHWDSVSLFAMPNVYVPEFVPVDVDTMMTPIIAVCESPRRPTPLK